MTRWLDCTGIPLRRLGQLRLDHAGVPVGTVALVKGAEYPPEGERLRVLIEADGAVLQVLHHGIPVQLVPRQVKRADAASHVLGIGFSEPNERLG